MSTTRGVTQLTINGTDYVDFSDIADSNWATAADVYPNKYFIGRDGSRIQGSGGMLQEKTVSADTQPVYVRPDEGKYLSKVTVNAIKAEEKTNITPNDSIQTIQPSGDNDFLSKVVINPVPTTVVTVTPKLGEQTIPRPQGEYFSKIIVDPILTKEAEAQSEIGINAKAIDITPPEGEYLSKVVILPITGTVATIVPSQDRQIFNSVAGHYYSEIQVAAIQAGECKLDPLKTDIWEATPENDQYYTKVTVTKIPRYSGKMEVR